MVKFSGFGRVEQPKDPGESPKDAIERRLKRPVPTELVLRETAFHVPLKDNENARREARNRLIANKAPLVAQLDKLVAERDHIIFSNSAESGGGARTLDSGRLDELKKEIAQLEAQIKNLR